MSDPRAGATSDTSAFVYEQFSYGADLDRILKCAALFFDRVVVKVPESADSRYDYLLDPMHNSGVLQSVRPEQILTPELLQLQTNVMLDLTLAGAFDYLGAKPYWADYERLGHSPVAFLNYATDVHRAFLAPVAEELLRRQLAVPVGTAAPDELRRMLEGKGMRGHGDEKPLFYEGPIAQKVPTATAQRGVAFPYFSHTNLIQGRVPVEDPTGQPFLQLAVHPDVAFLHEEIVRLIVYTRGIDGVSCHPFTSFPDYRRGKRFLEMLPKSPYSAVVMTDLEQVAVDLSSVPLDELLSFKDQYRRGLIEYRTALASTVSEISIVTDPRQREALLLRRQDELAIVAHDLKRACRKAFGLRLGSSAVGVVGVAWGLHQNDPVTAMVSAASAIVGAMSVSEPFSHVRYLHDIQARFTDR